MEADLLTQIILPLALFIIMLGMGLSLRIADFLGVFRAPKAVVLGLASQLLLLPLLGLLVAMLFGLEGELAVGLLILTFCPGGATSNMMSYLARGDLALSISLTALVSLITPFTIPIMAVVALEYFVGGGAQFQLPVLKTLLQLVLITLVPVGIGMAINAKKPSLAERADRSVKVVSVLFLFIIIAGIVVKNSASMSGFFLQTGLAALTLNLAALFVGVLVAKVSGLSRDQGITIAIEVGIQNGTVALFVAGTLLANPVMTIPAVTYSLIMFATIGFFILYQKITGH